MHFMSEERGGKMDMNSLFYYKGSIAKIKEMV